MRGTNGLGDDLRAFRRKVMDLTQEQMADKLGIPRTTYTAYEQERANVPHKVYEQLKKYGFGKAPEVTNPMYPSPVPVTLLPKGPPVPCSDWSDPLDSEYHEYAEVDSYLAGEGRFVTEMVGDSMYDLLWPGDVCVWQSTTQPKLGTTVIAVNRERQATCAQLRHDGKEFILHKLNPRYAPAEADHWECIGYLVAILRVQGTKRVSVFDPSGIRP
jgi:SOS-response transcriptional repressor LexA